MEEQRGHPLACSAFRISRIGGAVCGDGVRTRRKFRMGIG